MGSTQRELSKIIDKARVIEENSNQILDFTKEVKNLPEHTFGFIWENLSIAPLTPKSGEQDDHIAPIEFTAKNAMSVSALFTETAAIRSPFLTPIDLK